MRRPAMVLALLLLCISAACSAGIDVVSGEQYVEETEPIMSKWASAANTWKKEAEMEKTDYARVKDAETARSAMERIVSSWDRLRPPKGAEEYHILVRRAMSYDKEAFTVMAEYYAHAASDPIDQNESKRLRNQVIELWKLKDGALVEAKAALQKIAPAPAK